MVLCLWETGTEHQVVKLPKYHRLGGRRENFPCGLVVQASCSSVVELRTKSVEIHLLATQLIQDFCTSSVVSMIPYSINYSSCQLSLPHILSLPANLTIFIS